MLKIKIYIDVLFLINLIINYMLLCITSYLARLKKSGLQMALASVIGALYACFMFFPRLEIFYTLLFKFAVSLIIIVTAFKTNKIQVYIKAVFVFYMASFLLGGITFAVLYLTGAGTSMGMMISNGIFYFNMPWHILFVSTFLTYVLVHFVFRFYKSNKHVSYISVKVIIDSKQCVLNCLVDTGNMLNDPITNEPVIIAELEAVKKLLSKTLYNTVKEGCNFDFIPNSKEKMRLRIIPFTSLGNDNGMMLGFKPDFVIINRKQLSNVVIGIHYGSLSNNNDYNALIGANIEE